MESSADQRQTNIRELKSTEKSVGSDRAFNYYIVRILFDYYCLC